ncbi:unnamed protein product [Calypogeia fissa]
MDQDDEGHADLDSPGDNTIRETVSASASLECSAVFESESQLNGLKELEISDEPTSRLLPPNCPAGEKSRQCDQWAVEGMQSISDNKENIDVNTVSQESVLNISQLQSDRHETGERLKAETIRKIGDRRISDIRVDEVEVAESAITVNEGKAIIASQDEKQEDTLRQQLQLKLKEALEKVQMLESLLLSFQRKEKVLQQEKEEVITALEESELKSKEQSARLKEFENKLTRLKEQTAHLEKRCTTAESKAEESSSLLDQLQTKLEYSTMEHCESKNSNVQVEAMKLRLQECEKALSHATTETAKAESSLRELQLREEHVEGVEQGNKELEERLKWRNEQFQLLADAHSNMKSHFKEKRCEWDKENSRLLSDLDSLQYTMDSKECMLREAQKQLEIVHHALSREESRRKVLELEAAESRQAMEQATAGFEEAKFTLETLREQSSTEISTLRTTLGAKDTQLKDLQVKHIHLEQEYNELKEMDQKYRAWHSDHGEQLQQLRSMEAKMSGVVEANNTLRSRIKEVEKGFEKERRDIVKALDEAHDQLSTKDETVKQLGSELERLKGALEHAHGHRLSMDIQLKKCNEQLEVACVEAAIAREAFASFEKNSRAENSLLVESLHRKDKVIQDLKAQIQNMAQTITELSVHAEERSLMQKDYEELQQRQIQRDADLKELERIYNSLLLRFSQEENAWLVDRKKLVAEVQGTQEKASEVEKQLNEIHYKNERLLDVIRTIEAQCASRDKEMSEQCLLADQAREQFALERTEVEKEWREAQDLNESLSAALSHKDLTLEKLEDQIGVLEAELRRKDDETDSLNKSVCVLEMDVKETSEVLCNMEEHIAVMKIHASKTATELNLAEGIRTHLENDLRRSQEENLVVKTDLEVKLEVSRRDWSAVSVQLNAATQLLLEVSSQKELVLKDLDSKENCLMKLTVENKTLSEEKESLQQLVHVLESKKVGLLQEVESNRITINQLCDKYEAAQSNLASNCSEVKDLRAKLQNFHTVSVQLIKAEQQIRDLEGYLKAAKAIAQDKEENLAASEWAVQQLALDVGKAKAALAQKDREEAQVRDELAYVERQLRAKEGALIEMECYLEDALISRESMQTEVEQLRQQMEDLNRGAAEWKRKEQDMTIQLDVVGAALEEKREALLACELEIKKGNDLCEGMEGAIESLKLQLADEQRALLAQQEEMNRLCEDLERSKGEASSSSGLVKELHGRLQQLEQSSDDRINQFQSLLTELKGELSVAHLRLEKYENSTRLLTEESSRYKEKCEALLDLNTRKDSSLKDIEAQFLNVQASAIEQSKMLEQRDQDLQRAKEQRQYQDERQIRLEERLSRMQNQRSELQVHNEELLLELRKLRVQLEASSTEVALKFKETQSLHLQLEQMRLVVAQEGETKMLTTTLADELESLRRAVQEREARLRPLQAALDEAREKYQVLEANFACKDSEIEMLMDKLSTVEKRYKDSEGDLSRSIEALRVAQSTLSKNSEIISLNLRAINTMEVEITSWKEKAELCFTEVSSLAQGLHDASSKGMQSEKNAVKMQEALEGFQAEWLELKSRVATAESEVYSLKQRLEDVEGKRLQGHEEIVQVNEAMMRMERDLIEERGNVQRLSLLEHDLNESMKAAESASLIVDLQTQVVEWKKIADDSAKQRDIAKQEVLLIKEAMISVEHALMEDSGVAQLLSRAEDDLVEERRRVAKSAAAIGDLMVQVESWKTKAENAAKEGERGNQELQCATSTISNLMLQMESYQASEQAFKELSDTLQVDLSVAQEETLARKEQMEGFLRELEQSQESEKELLEYLQMEHKRLVADWESGGGFECALGIDSGNTGNISAARFGIRYDESKSKFLLEGSQVSTDDRTLAKVKEALEKQLEESRTEAHELSGKLNAALSNVAAKNQIIKQVNDEILGLRFQVKKLEEETLSIQQSIYGVGKLSSPDKRYLASERGDGQEKASPGKRKAEIQVDLNNYVELCDSLVRKNVRLEKQLDSLHRKNRGLQRQVEGLQMEEKSSLHKERRGLDPVDCGPEPVLLGLSRTNNANVGKPAAEARRIVYLQDICKGPVLGELDENAVPGNLQRCQLNRRPPISPAAATQTKKAKRVKDEA